VVVARAALRSLLREPIVAQTNKERDGRAHGRVYRGGVRRHLSRSLCATRIADDERRRGKRNTARS
jgi:hypothetical protein